MTNNSDSAASSPNKHVLRELDTEALDLARSLLRGTPTGSLGSLDPTDGAPFTSLVTVATDLDGSPLILVSTLSTHTQALMADPRCSVLLSRPGPGDPLAHPRMTVTARARFLERDSDDGDRAAHRFLTRHQKAALYAGFGDFSFVRLEPVRASLNGGFGKAYELTDQDLLCPAALLDGYDAMEPSAVQHMNEDHQQAIQHYATVLCSQPEDAWRMTGLDPHGIDMAGDRGVCRLAFDPPLSSVDEVRPRLVALARQEPKQ